MNIFDIIKWEVTEEELVYRYPSDNIRLGSQLVVYPGQMAMFVKGGKVYDEFESGTYTIKTENIPLLGKLINVPFNSETPFKAEIWFVNQISLLDCKWGTTTPLQIEDPLYNVIVPIRAYGQYGFKVVNPRLFLERLVGNMSSFLKSRITDYFRGVIVSKMTSIIYNKMKEDDLTILNINSKVDELSDYAKLQISKTFLDYGLEIELFTVMSVTVQENDQSFLRLKAAKDAAAKINIIGKSNYQMTRSFDVLEKAAQNSSGGTMSTAVGIGAGLGIGNMVGNLVTQNMSTNPQDSATPPPMPTATTYYLAVNGMRQGPFDFATIAGKIANGELTESVLVWKRGMATWEIIMDNADFANLFAGLYPPPIPNV